MPPGQIDPAVAPLRRANPQRFREARPGHLALVHRPDLRSQWPSPMDR
ncbi:hypothetical protein [Cyanobium sp. Cruz-8H5]|nr:hypothetical protein [Cyanobium sp. Cruz-8H5]